jgi:tRNA (guanosine-2'-O-)-methyltransferase
MRGYFAIGVYNIKNEINVGTLWRSAFALGALYFFTIGRRYTPQCSDTTQSHRHIPYHRFSNESDFLSHIPYDCQLVGVEITPEARPLESFIHPRSSIYLLGPEDGSLSEQLIMKCQHIVKFNSKFCLNVSTAGSIVMYDRATKVARR